MKRYHTVIIAAALILSACSVLVSRHHVVPVAIYTDAAGTLYTNATGALYLK
jgi:hypothetical protein